jgi:hypothetical protein
MKRLLVIAMAVSFLACSKNSSDIPASIEGYWTGKWGFQDDPPDNDMAVIFRSDGTCRVIYGHVGDTAKAMYKTENSYTYVDGEVHFSYKEGSNTYVHYSKPSVTRMDGTWGESPNTTGGGKFYLDKKLQLPVKVIKKGIQYECPFLLLRVTFLTLIDRQSQFIIVGVGQQRSCRVELDSKESCLSCSGAIISYYHVDITKRAVCRDRHFSA